MNLSNDVSRPSRRRVSLLLGALGLVATVAVAVWPLSVAVDPADGERSTYGCGLTLPTFLQGVRLDRPGGFECEAKARVRVYAAGALALFSIATLTGGLLGQRELEASAVGAALVGVVAVGLAGIIPDEPGHMSGVALGAGLTAGAAAVWWGLLATASRGPSRRRGLVAVAITVGVLLDTAALAYLVVRQLSQLS